MFAGEYEHTVDAKGRVFVPACFRDQMLGKIYVTRTKIRCVKIYTQKAWEEYAAQIEAIEGDDYAKATRYVYRRTYEAELDSSGRLLIPEKLRSHAELKKDVVIVGRGKIAEIWDSDIYRQYVDEEDEDDIDGLFGKYGIKQ